MGLERGPVGRLWRGRIREGQNDVDVVVKQTEDGIQIILPEHLENLRLLNNQNEILE